LEANKNINIIYRSSVLEQWWDLLDETWRGIFIAQFGESGVEPDLETLHQWTAQSKVIINDAQISNLAHLLVFNNLRELYVTEVPIIDFSHVGQMLLLEELAITYAPVTDLTFLVSLNNLVSLDLSKTGIEDLRPLGSLTGLQSLTISGTNIKVLRGLETLTNLKDLDIASTNVRSLKPVQGLNIERLICFNTRLNQRAVDSFKQLNPNADVRFY
jgi:Leucine-rich repeat (LRR) protein